MKYCCVFCDRTFYSWKELGRHTAEQHRGASKKACGWCDFTTCRQSDLDRHMRRNHGGRSPRRPDERRARPRERQPAIRPYRPARPSCSRRPTPEAEKYRGGHRGETRQAVEPRPQRSSQPDNPVPPQANQPASSTSSVLLGELMESLRTPSPMMTDTTEGPRPTTTSEQTTVPSTANNSTGQERNGQDLALDLMDVEFDSIPLVSPSSPTMDDWVTEMSRDIDHYLQTNPGDIGLVGQPTAVPVAEATAPEEGAEADQALNTPPARPTSEDELKETAPTTTSMTSGTVSSDVSKETATDGCDSSSLAPGDPRLFRVARQDPPKTAAGGEVRFMRDQARQDPDARRTRHDLLHQLDFGISIRQVTETATFPDGRVYKVHFTEYNLPSNHPTPSREWTTGPTTHEE